MCFQLSYRRRKTSVVETQAAHVRPKPGTDPRLGSGTTGQTDAVAEEASRLLKKDGGGAYEKSNGKIKQEAPGVICNHGGLVAREMLLSPGKTWQQIGAFYLSVRRPPRLSLLPFLLRLISQIRLLVLASVAAPRHRRRLGTGDILSRQIRASLQLILPPFPS